MGGSIGAGTSELAAACGGGVKGVPGAGGVSSGGSTGAGALSAGATGAWATEALTERMSAPMVRWSFARVEAEIFIIVDPLKQDAGQRGATPAGIA